MRVLVLAAAAVLCLGSATTYGPMGMTGGYEDQRLGPDRFFIHCRGNAFVSTGEVMGFFHRRAAEVCAQAGYRSYEVETLGDRPRTYYQRGAGGTVSQIDKPDVYGTVRCTH